MATPLTIENPEAYTLASQIARRTGKTLTRAVLDALRAEATRLELELDTDRARETLSRIHHEFRIVENRDWQALLNDDLVEPKPGW